MYEFIDCGIKGIGVDCLQIENPVINISEEDTTFKSDQEFKRRLDLANSNMAHIKILQEDILIIENLTNLDKILNKEVMFICLPPKFGMELKEMRTDDNSIVRAIAIELKDLAYH